MVGERSLVALVLAFLFLVGASGIFIIWSAFIGAGWEPTSRKKVRMMLEMSGAGPSDVVYDLGCGDGRILVEAAKTFHARAVGVEADPIRALYCRITVSVRHLGGQARVIWANFFHVDLTDATVVTLFLSQGTNRRLKPKLLSELRPGARVVSYVWTFEDWAPRLRDPANELSLYVVPGVPAGTPAKGPVPGILLEDEGTPRGGLSPAL